MVLPPQLVGCEVVGGAVVGVVVDGGRDLVVVGVVVAGGRQVEMVRPPDDPGAGAGAGEEEPEEDARVVAAVRGRVGAGAAAVAAGGAGAGPSVTGAGAGGGGGTAGSTGTSVGACPGVRATAWRMRVNNVVPVQSPTSSRRSWGRASAGVVSGTVS